MRDEIGIQTAEMEFVAEIETIDEAERLVGSRPLRVNFKEEHTRKWGSYFFSCDGSRGNPTELYRFYGSEANAYLEKKYGEVNDD